LGGNDPRQCRNAQVDYDHSYAHKRDETVPDKTAIEEMSFEVALAELEKIVSKLESGDVPLEQSISLYERGDALRAHCDARLKEASLKVDKIVTGADGSLSTEPADIG